MTRTDPLMPPCGPERDRLVAEAVGWEWDDAWYTAWDRSVPGPDMPLLERCPSQSDADAFAALEAWRVGAPDRSYKVDAPDTDDPTFWVGLMTPRSFGAFASAPTLRDAATAALVRWRNERSAP